MQEQTHKLKRIKIRVCVTNEKEKKRKKNYKKRNERKAKATTAKRITALTVTTQAERVNQINRCPDIQGGKREGWGIVKERDLRFFFYIIEMDNKEKKKIIEFFIIGDSKNSVIYKISQTS